MSSSEEDTIIILSTQYLPDPIERLESTDTTCTHVTVGRSKNETVVARAVVAVSLALLSISILLVIGSLIMSHHIDQLVRDANKNFWNAPGAIISSRPELNHTHTSTTSSTTPGR